MKYDVTKGGYILLGRCGENLARTVEIDVSEYLKEYPGAVVTLLHRRHGEDNIYPVAAELRDGCLIWQPTSADTAIVGDGEAEVRVTVDGVLAKSKIISTVVSRSLTGQETDAPEPSKDWVDKVIGAVTSVHGMTAKAESVAYGEPATAEYDGETGTMRFGIPEGKPGKDGTDGKDGAPGEKGDKGEPGERGLQGEPGSDASVTADNIQSALGYAPVKDVQVGGASVLDANTAYIPNVAFLNDQGVLRVANPPAKTQWTHLIGVLPNGQLVLAVASRSTINTRDIQFIGGDTLDYAVKAAMCDGKGAAWTADEQKAARERMGADGDYVLIESLSLTEAVTVFERNSEPDGTPYNLIALKVIVKFIPGQASGGFYFYGYNSSGNEIVAGSTENILMPSADSPSEYRSTAVVDVKPLFGLYDCTASQGAQGIAMKVTRAKNGDYQLSSTESKIAKFDFHLYGSTSIIAIIAGTEIEIYGVRA